jgi:signal transduction histidine kinase
VEGRLQLVATYPPGAADDSEPPALYETEARDDMRTVTVAQNGRPLGVLRVKQQASRPMTPVENRLLGGLAAQAEMVLETAQLRAELASRVAELSEREVMLRRTRDELASAQDSERRRLERDIHDGAQQQLVALAINLKLAKTLGSSDPVAARKVLEEQQVAVSEAIATLSDLSAGLLPELLTRRGLGPALIAATAGNPVPVHVDAPPLEWHAPETESALYFCALEAVQNSTKHAQASRIDVHLHLHAGRLVLTVEDDGTGLGGGTGSDRDAVAGSGLRNMRERAEAIGGELAVTSRPLGGTTVVVAVPAADAAVVGTA